MRRSDRWTPPAALTLAWALVGCAIPLDDEPATRSGPPTREGCPLLGDASLTDSGRSAQVDGADLWFVYASQGFARTTPAGLCAPSPLIPLSVRPPEGFPTASVFLRDAVRVGPEIWFFYTATRPLTEAPSGSGELGGGLARLAGDTVEASALRWPADGPRYGGGALVHGGYVYAYGCEAAGSDFRSRCAVARASIAGFSGSTAWQYAQGAGRWGDSPEQAAFVVEANERPSVRSAGGRFVMAYAPVLGNEVVIRTAPAPEGPWSRAEVAFRCALPSGANWICADVALHNADGDQLTVVYTPRQLEGPGRAGPRVVEATIPPGLP